MKNKIISLALIAGLAACSGGNPFDTPEEGGTDGEVIGDGEGTGIDRDGIPPGTVSPSPNASLFRSEPSSDGAAAGNGFATGLRYNSGDDTFTVDNLAFDGDRPYARVDADGNPNVVQSLNEGRFAVFEGPSTSRDPVSGDEINQFTYRAVYGVSTNRTAANAPTTQFAIVRTGSYVDYGFGGFIYQRDNTVTLPSALQGQFTGHSAGLRDFGNSSGLQYTTADVRLTFDFQDFNDGQTIRGDGVNGRIFNRLIFDLDGNEITPVVAASLGTEDEPVTSIPDVFFEVGPDVLDDNGDLVTNIQSIFPDGTTYETGTFYAIVAGDDPDEVVGVFVLESTVGDVNSRDTGGFIVYRGASATP